MLPQRSQRFSHGLLASLSLVFLSGCLKAPDRTLTLQLRTELQAARRSRPKS